jgi:predicted TIM-barrel fold metal-dependent hydrolase
MCPEPYACPYYAPQIRALASELREMPVILDHLARYGQGTPAEFEEVLRLAELPCVYMKYSAVHYSSKQEYPHRDAKPFIRRLFDAFGADRIIWGGLHGVALAWDILTNKLRNKLKKKVNTGIYKFISSVLVNRHVIFLVTYPLL